jgi:hypothetical protein
MRYVAAEKPETCRIRIGRPGAQLQSLCRAILRGSRRVRGP